MEIVETIKLPAQVSPCLRLFIEMLFEKVNVKRPQCSTLPPLLSTQLTAAAAIHSTNTHVFKGRTP